MTFTREKLRRPRNSKAIDLLPRLVSLVGILVCLNLTLSSLVSCAQRDRRVRPNPIPLGNREEKHGRVDYYFVTIEPFYQLNGWRVARPDEIYVFANYSVRGNDPKSIGPSNETLVLALRDGTKYYPDRGLTEQFDSSYLTNSPYDGQPYYTSEKLSTSSWHDHFAIYLVPLSKVLQEAKLQLVDEAEMSKRPILGGQK